MKLQLLCLMLLVSSLCIAQDKADAAMKRFPGFTKPQMEKVLKARKKFCIPLPTWVPAGFAVEEIKFVCSDKIRADEWALHIIYGKTTDAGKKQRFIIDAGLEGIGDLLYESTHIIRSGVGEIGLCYNPRDEDGKRMKNYVRTQWFECDSTAYAYGSCDGMGPKGRNTVMISLDETKKIIASLKRL